MLRKAQHHATHEVFTGVPNRALFNELVNKQIASCKRDNTQFTVMDVDLAGFKPVNDSKGHAAGDKLLGDGASRLRSQLRDADMAARVGGDVFAVILVGTPAGMAKTVAAKLIHGISARYHLDN